jgi:hypothetical protein
VKIIATISAVVILANPALAAQKPAPNAPLLQLNNQIMAVAKPKPKPKKQEPYLIIRMNDAPVTSY